MLVAARPDHDRALVSLLHAIGRADKVVDRGRPARTVKARAKEIAEGAWAAQAVRGPDRGSQAAIAAAVASRPTVTDRGA